MLKREGIGGRGAVFLIVQRGESSRSLQLRHHEETMFVGVGDWGEGLVRESRSTCSFPRLNLGRTQYSDPGIP